jgi:hypothetical protein
MMPQDKILLYAGILFLAGLIMFGVAFFVKLHGG